jgi:DNA-binding transcriptional LysR family regulator
MPILTTAARCFEKVAEGHSIRAAAQVLGIAPSAVNRHILRLESELGVPLFERLPRGLRLAAPGELLLAHLKRTGDDRARLDDDIQSLSGARIGTVKIATIEACTHDLIPRASVALRAQLPGMRVQVLVGSVDFTINALATGEADIAVSFNAPEVRQVRAVHAVPYRLGAAVPPDHKLAGRGAVTLDDCVPYAVVLPDETLFGRSTIGMALQAGGPRFRIAAICNRYSALVAMVRNGFGIGFLTRLDVGRELHSRELRWVPLRDPRVPMPVLSLLRPRGRKAPGGANVMLGHLAKLMDPDAD